jgi:tetratricopeptide (TPR) repeat protein
MQKMRFQIQGYMKKWVIGGLFFWAMGLQAQEYQPQIYQFYLEGRMDQWKEVMDQMYSEYEKTASMELLYELTEAQYGYIAYCLSVKQKKEAAKLLDLADEHIETLLKWQKNNPRIYSLKGALYGFRIQLKPLRAPSYGKKSVKANDKAIQLGPREPQAWMEKANIAYYKPKVFGGSKSEAVLLYEKAVKLYEAIPERTMQNWLYLNCLMGLGMAYEKTDQIQAAGIVYEKVLKMEPTFKWLSEEVYPQFREKHLSN